MLMLNNGQMGHSKINQIFSRRLKMINPAWQIRHHKKKPSFSRFQLKCVRNMRFKLLTLQSINRVYSTKGLNCILTLLLAATIDFCISRSTETIKSFHIQKGVRKTKNMITPIWKLLAAFAITISVLSGNAVAREFVVANTYANEVNAAVAYSRLNQQFLVVYAQPWGGNFGIKICFQMLDAAGNRTGGRRTIFSSANHWYGFRPWISVVYNKYLGRYLIAWNWMDRKGDKWAIYTTKISFTGRLERGPLKVIESRNHLKQPNLIYNSRRHNFVLAWQQSGSGSNMYSIYATNLSLSGTYKYNKIIKLSDVAGSHENPKLAFNREQNQIFATWEHWWPGSGHRRIRGCILTGDASRASRSIYLEYRGNRPNVVYNTATGLYLVVWKAAENGDSVIEGRHLRPYGMAYTLSYPFMLANKRVGAPDIVYNSGNEEYMMVFDRVYPYSSEVDRDIYGSVFFDLGESKDEFIIYDQSYWTKDEYRPRIAYNENRDEYLVIWQHKYGPNDVDIHGRIIAPN
jgi:hypothetical protein